MAPQHWLIKRVTKHMSPRETRVVALGRPGDRDCKCIERWLAHLPVGEIVFFNRLQGSADGSTVRA
jgi:polyphosphate kinase 2 (PPK2 family)